MDRLTWSSVAARVGLPGVEFGPNLKAGEHSYAFNAYWYQVPPAANDDGPEAA